VWGLFSSFPGNQPFLQKSFCFRGRCVASCLGCRFVVLRRSAPRIREKRRAASSPFFTFVRFFLFEGLHLETPAGLFGLSSAVSENGVLPWGACATSSGSMVMSCHCYLPELDSPVRGITETNALVGWSYSFKTLRGGVSVFFPKSSFPPRSKYFCDRTPMGLPP